MNTILLVIPAAVKRNIIEERRWANSNNYRSVKYR